MKTDWKRLAAKAIQEGYLSGNPWELDLKRHLERLFPALVKELGPAFPHDLQVQTSNAMDFEDQILDSGTHPETARELARDRLLPKPPDEEDRPAAWELEAAKENEAEAAMKFLTAKPKKPTQNQSLFGDD